jgi:hypothetical protein
MKTKRIFPVIVFVLFLTALGSTTIIAQNLKQWTWSEYSTKFKAPSDLEITLNDASGFSGTNSDIALSIYPMMDEDLSYSEMESELRTWVKENGVRSTQGTEYLDDLSGYWGCFIEGTKDGFPVFAMLVIDPDFPEISLYVWLSYRESYEDVALDILLSFKPI